MKSTIFFLLAVTIICFDLHGQLATSTAMKKMSEEEKTAFKTRLREYNVKVQARIRANFKGDIKKRMLEEYRDYTTAFISEIDEDKYLFNVKMDTFLYSVFDKIKHPDITERPVFLIAKDYRYNAFCTPEGFIIVNMAVFNFAENEDQIASLICHELAHHKLDHFLKGSAALWEDEISKKSNKELKDIKSGNDIPQKAMILLRKKLYENSRIKRKSELEADSLGFIFYKSTAYSPGSFINTLENIERMDSIKQDSMMDTTLYQELFDLRGFAFSYDLLQDEKTAYKYFNIEDDFNADSLASHPEILERTKNLQRLYAVERDTQSIQSDGIIYALYQDVHDELLPLLYLNEEYGAALFVTLQYMDVWRGKPEFEQYKAWLGILFKKLVEARTNYTFNRYVEKRTASMENIGYKKFLNFLWNLDLSDMKIILRTYEPHIRN